MLALRALPPPEAPPEGWGLVRCQRLSAALDRLLSGLFGAPAGAALAAVGSYGRGAPALGSDADVRLLVADRAQGEALAEALLYPLWDARVQVGHQVVTPDELIELSASDLKTATALLDWRLLGGDAGLSAATVERARREIFDGAGFERLLGWVIDEVNERHERFGGSVYLLEPDVKNGAGGLRDLDAVGWLLLARGRQGLEALADERLASPAELAQLARARELMARVRNLLHASAGRRADRLTFEAQEAIARRLGYGQQAREVLGPEADEEEALRVAVEALMSDYYRHAQLLSRMLERLLRRLRPLQALAGLDEGPGAGQEPAAGLAVRDGCLELSPGVILSSTPAAALGIYVEAVRLGLPLGASSRERVARAASDEDIARKLRADPAAAGFFLGLCASAAETPQLGRTVMDELREVGLLTAMIPEFSPVVGRVHHDIYHVYTVDVHSVAALDRLKALVRGELAEAFPLASRLAAEEIDPAVLHLSALLHDVGKALGGRGHEVRGAAMAEAIARRLGLAEGQVARVARLVRTHLVMYHVATRRDLDDPSTLEEFAQHLEGRESLRELYLLTVADLSTTSPTALSAWKAKLLDDLYVAADKALEGSLVNPHDELSAQRARDEVLGLEGGSAFARSFVGSMPARYLLGNPPGAVAAHLEVARAASDASLACGLRPLSSPGLSELCVVARDRPGLLAAIAAAIVSCRLEVHGAQIHSYQPAEGPELAVDLFWVRGAPLEQPARLTEALRHALGDFIEQRKPVAEALGARGASPWASRRTPAVSTQVSIDDRSSPTASIVEVVTRDRPGVLCALALAFHQLGLSISLAKINTEGARVADVFYVTDSNGNKIELLPRKSEIKARITDILSPLASTPA